MFRGWMGLCSPWNLMALTIVLGGSYVQDIISLQQHHLHALVQNSNSILMWREAKTKGIKEKCVSNKIERKILEEKRDRKALQATEGEWRRKMGKWEDRMKCWGTKTNKCMNSKWKSQIQVFHSYVLVQPHQSPVRVQFPDSESQKKIRLKKTSEAIKSDHSSSTARATPSHVPKGHLYTSFKSLQAWWLPHSLGQPVVVLDDPLGNEIFPNIFPKAPFMELYGFHRALWIGSTSGCGWGQPKQRYLTHSTIHSSLLLPIPQTIC